MLIQFRKGLKKGQTAMEYAMIVGALSLVLMFAWKTFGSDISGVISNQLKQEVHNATSPTSGNNQ